MDENGWLVPRNVQRERSSYGPEPKTLREKALFRYSGEDWQQRQEKRYYVWAAGRFPEPLQKEESSLAYMYMAKSGPVIPAWFGSRPPLQAVFLPNGEILAYGPLNLHFEERPGERPFVTIGEQESENWYHYSPDGKLLRVLERGSKRDRFQYRNDWMSLFVDFSLVEQAFRERGVKYGTNFLGPYRAYVRHELKDDGDWGSPVEVLAIYDMQGNLVDQDTPWQHSPYVGTTLPRSMIEQMFKAQVEIGLIDPAAQSPFEGTPEGPVAVDPTPRPRPLLAKKMIHVEHEKGGWTFGGEEILEVKPLDHPDNPYRGQYGPWDEWILKHHGLRNPLEDAHFQEQSRKHSEEVRKAIAENRKPASLSYSGYIQPLDDPWTRFGLTVDDEGFVVPLLVREEEQRRMRKEQEQRPAPSIYLQERPKDRFRIEGGGVVPPEIAAQLLQELKARGLREFPPETPAWMRAAPPHSFMVMPNGEYVTNGPLGSWKENWQLDYVQPIEGGVKIDRASRGWYRYSADGELLGSIPEGSWLQLFNPNYASLELSGKSQGYDAIEYGGYLIWVKKGAPDAPYAGDAGTIVAKWDYLGNPVAPDAPLTYPWKARFWNWDEVVRMERGVLPQAFY